MSDVKATEVKLIAANNMKDFKEEVLKFDISDFKGHKIKDSEKEYVHAVIVRKEYSKTDGEPLFKPSCQIFDKKEWTNWLGHRNGLTVLHILNLPKGALTVEQFDAAKKKALEAAAKKAK